MKRITSLLAVALALTVLAGRGHAGGPGVSERRLELGKCMPSGARCVYDCNSDQAVCLNPAEKCTLDATQVFTGLLTWEINDSPCSLSLTLEGRTESGFSFTASQSNITTGCSGPVNCATCCPRPNPFHCGGEARLTESPSFADLNNWLLHNKFPSGIAQQISQQVGGTGEPIIVKSENCMAVDDNSQNSMPTTARFCIKGYLVRTLPTQAPTCVSGGTTVPCPCS